MMAPQTRASRWLLAMMGLLIVVRLVGMAWLPLMDTTEARYAEIGRKMLELGDWVTPWHDYGVPFWGKPPLSFWLTAASFKVLGVSEFAARLPHFLCMLAVAMTAWGLARARSRSEGLMTLALLAGASLFFVSAGAVMTDGALAVGTTLAMRGFWFGMHAPDPTARRRESWFVFAGLAIGLLAKGPLALVLIALPILSWSVLTRRVREVWAGLPWLLGLALAVLAAAPWFVAAEFKTPGFLEYFLVGEHWHRFVTPGWKGDLYGNAHRFPPGTVWLFAVAATLPWSLLLPVAAWTWRSMPLSGSRLGNDRPWVLYLACWSLAPLVFFTAARNIIWTYALPALPAMALLAAVWLARRVAPERGYGLLAGGLAVSLMVGIILGLNLQVSGAIETKSAKSLVARWAAERTGDEPLVFVGSRLFSASYYSAGSARLVTTPEEAADLLQRRRGFVAMPHGTAPKRLDARLLGRYGRYDLYVVTVAKAQAPS